MKVELNDPAMPKETIFEVVGLGLLENGKTTEFSAEEVSNFEATQGKTLQEAFKGSSIVKVSESAKEKGGDD